VKIITGSLGLSTASLRRGSRYFVNFGLSSATELIFLNKKSSRFDSGDVQVVQVKHDQPVGVYMFRISLSYRISNKKHYEGPFHKRRNYCIYVNGIARLPGRAVEDSKYHPVTEGLRIRRQRNMLWLPHAKSWSNSFLNSVSRKRAKARVNN